MNWGVKAYDLPLAVPYRWSHGEQDHRAGVIVRCRHRGATGWGEIAPPPDEVPEDLERQAHGWQDTWQKAPPRIRCGYATAWYDALARAEGIKLAQYLHQELDAPRPRSHVQVNALLTAPLEGILEEARGAWQAGHRTFKIKVGQEGDEARAAAVREAFPRAVIRLDANAAWSPAEAAARIEALAPLRIEYIEQPVAPGAEQALRRLNTDGPIPVALDESATDARAIQHAIQEGLGDHIILKPQRVGGPDRAVEIIKLCHDEGIGLTVTNSLETSVGLHAGLHVASVAPDVACGLGTARYFARDVAATPSIVDGVMRVTGPGSGVVL